MQTMVPRIMPLIPMSQYFTKNMEIGIFITLANIQAYICSRIFPVPLITRLKLFTQVVMDMVAATPRVNIIGTCILSWSHILYINGEITTRKSENNTVPNQTIVMLFIVLLIHSISPFRYASTFADHN